MNKDIYILGIDGGGSSTEGIIFNQNGKPLVKLKTNGTNLYVYKQKAVKSIAELIINLSRKIDVDFSQISAFGLGLAGISDLRSRDLLLNELDKMNISSRSIVLSDTESAYQLLCPTGQGILLSIGTGIVCLGRNKTGKTFKIAGKGYDQGDIGSGYWIGKKAINKILLNQEILSIDNEMKEIFDCIRKKLQINDINLLERSFNKEGDIVYKTASLAKDIIYLASKGNDVALSIIQEGTRYVSEYIIYLINEMDYDKNKVIIAGHGSIIKNNFYRKLLNDSLQFDIGKLHWIFSDISCAYSSGIISAKCRKINISINQILKYLN